MECECTLSIKPTLVLFKFYAPRYLQLVCGLKKAGIPSSSIIKSPTAVIDCSSVQLPMHPSREPVAAAAQIPFRELRLTLPLPLLVALDGDLLLAVVPWRNLSSS